MSPAVTESRCRRCGVLVPAGSCPRCGVAAPLRERGPRGGQAGGLVRGLLAPFRGFGFVGAHPRLWAWVVVPLAVNAALFVGIAVVLVLNLGEWMPSFDEPWPAWIDWLRTSLGVGLLWVARLLAVLAAFLATLLVSGVVNAPFYDKLSEAAEATALGGRDPGRPWAAFVGDVGRSLSAALSLALRQALVMAVLFAFSFTGVGAVLFAVAGMYYTGLAQIDIVLGRKLYRGGERSRWGRRRFGLTLGAGVPVTLLPLLQPFGIVGTTLAYLDEPEKG